MDEKTALGLLEGLESVSAARISTDGRLLEARGFLAGVLPEGPVAAAFRTPAWEAFRAAPAGQRTELTLAPAFRVNGVLHRTPEGFVLVAELPAEDLEGMSRAAVRMANELALVRAALAEAQGALDERDETVRRMAFVDRITGLGNRRSFEQALAGEVLRAERYGGPLALVLVSIDGLEALSRAAADDVLRCFAGVVGHATRKTDLAARVGDNRFMLLLTHTASERAGQVMSRIRAAFAAAAPGMVASAVGVSFGQADWREGDQGASLQARAEAALAAALAGSGASRA